MDKLVKKLGAYKGIQVPKMDRTISEAEMQAELDRAAQCASRTYEKDKAEDGDCIVIDFKGAIDGVAFAGGEETDCPLELGSGRFIPGFEDQLFGATKGDRIDVKVTFPKDYQAEELAGKDAVFDVTVKGVYGLEVPELTDEIIRKVSEQDTIEEFKEFVKGEILHKRETDYARHKEDFLMAKIIEDSEVEIPYVLINERAELIRQDLEKQLSQSGKTIEQYMQANGLSREEYLKLSEEDAKMMLEGQAVLDEIAEIEGFTYTKEELEEEIGKMAELYNMKVKELRSTMGLFGENMLGEDIKSRKAIDYILEQSIEV